MWYINCFFHIVWVTTDMNSGLSLEVISLISVLRGAAVSVQFGTYCIPHTVICCLLFVSAYLYLMNSVTWFNQLCALMRIAWVSIHQIASYCIHFARCNSPMGLNILLCADRFQTNIDGIINGSSNYIVHSYYNRSIADVQLRASSFLYKLVSSRDSRQSIVFCSAVQRSHLTQQSRKNLCMYR